MRVELTLWQGARSTCGLTLEDQWITKRPLGNVTYIRNLDVDVELLEELVEQVRSRRYKVRDIDISPKQLKLFTTRGGQWILLAKQSSTD